jgi:hypothetical protein
MEYDADEGDFEIAHLTVHSARDVHHVAEAADPLSIPPCGQIQVPKHGISRRSLPRSTKSTFPPPKPKVFQRRSSSQRSKTFVPRAHALFSKQRKRPRHSPTASTRLAKRDPPPHLAPLLPTPPDNPLIVVLAPANAITMGTACTTTAASVVDASHCSIHTAPIASDVHPLKEPVPPDIPGPAAVSLSVSPAGSLVPDTVLIPRLPEPPNIGSATARLAVTDSVAAATIPKPPNIALAAIQRQ